VGTQHKDKCDYLGCLLYRYKLKGLSKGMIDECEAEEKMELEAHSFFSLL